MALNPKPSLLDQTQILQRSFNSDDDTLRVDAQFSGSIGTVECIITNDSDNIAIGTSTQLFTATTVGSQVALDVNLVSDGTPLNVTDSSTAALNSKVSDNYGVSTVAVRTASQIGNTTGAADFNLGSTTAQTLRTSSNLNDGSGNAITSASYNSNRLVHVNIPDNVTTTTTLGAINATIVIQLNGLGSVGFQLNSGTFIGQLVAEASIDGGTKWEDVPFYDPANSAILTNLTYTSANGDKIVSIIPIGGSSHVRVRVSAYTSGSATSLLRAANVSGATGAITSAAFAQVTNVVLSLTSNTPSLVLSNNPNRKYAYFGNNSSSTIRLQFASATGLSNLTGIPLPSSTGFYELKGENLFTGDVYAFCGSNVQISVTEGTP